MQHQNQRNENEIGNAIRQVDNWKVLSPFQVYTYSLGPLGWWFNWTQTILVIA